MESSRLRNVVVIDISGFWLRMVLKMGEVCKPITRLADWRCSMATSSFVERIRVNNPKVMEEYVAAMETAANAPVAQRPEKRAKEIKDPQELKKLMLKGIEKWEKK